MFGDMEATRAYLLRAKEFLKQCSKQAKEEGDEAVACLVDSLLAGERAQLEGLEELRQKLDAKAVEFQKKEYDFPTLADALESYAAEAAAWAYDTVPGMVQRARKEGYRDVYFGRRPAFCTICNQPNFEMERMRRGVLD